MEEPLEGWYTDPYARHEARWMSQGTPTALVRDGDVEGDDPVAHDAFSVIPVRVGDDASPNGGSDLRRADDAEREGPYNSKQAMRRVLDIIEQRPIQ